MKLSRTATRALSELETHGFLLLQDAKLPNLAALIAGCPVSGSWWGHPAGKAIFNTAGELEDHPDIFTAKLVSGKVTFVHRRFFPALVAIGRAREKWQLDGLDKSARALLVRVDRETQVLAKGPPAKQLEKRLLVASREVHTESGAHATELVDWDAFARERKVKKLGVERAKSEIEAALAEMSRAKPRLPWQTLKRRS